MTSHLPKPLCRVLTRPRRPLAPTTTPFRCSFRLSHPSSLACSPPCPLLQRSGAKLPRRRGPCCACSRRVSHDAWCCFCDGWSIGALSLSLSRSLERRAFASALVPPAQPDLVCPADLPPAAPRKSCRHALQPPTRQALQEALAPGVTAEASASALPSPLPFANAQTRISPKQPPAPRPLRRLKETCPVLPSRLLFCSGGGHLGRSTSSQASHAAALPPLVAAPLLLGSAPF